MDITAQEDKFNGVPNQQYYTTELIDITAQEEKLNCVPNQQNYTT